MHKVVVMNVLSFALANIDIFGVCFFIYFFIFSSLVVLPNSVKERQLRANEEEEDEEKIGHPAGPEFTANHFTCSK